MSDQNAYQLRLALVNAKIALQQKNKMEARRWASEALRIAPESEEAWLIFAAIASPSASLAYLQKVLQINPKNERAAKGLKWAQSRIEEFRAQTPGIKVVSIPSVKPEVMPVEPPVAEREIYSSWFSQNMTSLLSYSLKRLLSIVVTLFITTLLLYAIMMLTPPETRAELFMPKNLGPRMTEEMIAKMLQRKIEENHLNDPYPVQYYYWIKNLLKGEWGFSRTMNEGVLAAILKRTPVTAELTLYSILVFIPLGLLSGVIAGTRKNKAADHSFRFVAYVATSLPPFILALVLLSIFYVNLNWFSPERASSDINLFVISDQFHTITGLLTIDGLLNGRPDVTFDAFRHMVLPVFTLALAHWATLGRITRTAMIDVQHQDYVIAARARGASEKRITWRHMFPNAVTPALASSVLSAASLVTGVFVVEVIFNFHGISEVALKSMQFIPDAQTALGFTIYSVIVVLILMTVLDVIQTLLDPRIIHGRN